MPFENTLALAALASIIPLIILYLLRPRPQKINVPSLMFLMNVAQKKKRFYTSITKIIKDPLFLIQLLVLILLSTAAAAPFYTAEEDLSGEHTVLVMDMSASMQTEDRFDSAINVAKGYVSKKNSIILAKNIPVTVLQGGGASDTEDELDKLEPGATVSDLSAAISDGMRLLSQEGGRIIVISDFTYWDGEDPVSAKNLAESYALDVNFIRVGKTTDNVGIIQGWLEAENAGYTYNCVIKNYADNSKNVGIEINTNNGGDHSSTMELSIGAGSTKQFQVTNLGTGLVTIKIIEPDNLMMDNVAYISIPGTKENEVLLITDTAGLPSHTALSLVPNVKMSVSQGVPTDPGNYRVVVVANKDRILTSNESSRLKGFVRDGGNVVFIASDALSAGSADKGLLSLLPVSPIAITDTPRGTILEEVQPTRLTKDIKFNEIAVYRSLNATARPDSTTLVATGDNIPILTYWSVGDGTVMYLGFNDVLGEDSWNNFHNLPEYPVMWIKIIGWLGGVGDINDYNTRTGAIAALATEQEITTPSTTMGVGKVLYDEVGFYKIAGKQIAVNLYDDRESDTTINASDVIERALDQNEPDIVKETTYTVHKYLDDHLIILVLLLVVLEILIIRKRGQL
ncbi:MAG: BatA domain-containing protein [Methanosarcinaceae archaeon]|nr:BatA domain-containing protein [Methanosarcinaceae archaeon]